MSKKDYEMIAKVFKRQYASARKWKNDRAQITLDVLVNDLCEEFIMDNTGFDADKFRTACGYDLED